MISVLLKTYLLSLRRVYLIHVEGARIASCVSLSGGEEDRKMCIMSGREYVTAQRLFYRRRCRGRVSRWH
jgi:hypothetical protein